MRSRIYTIISGHFKSWYRSKSNIFWTIAFPLLLIVLFGAIFGNGSTKLSLRTEPGLSGRDTHDALCKLRLDTEWYGSFHTSHGPCGATTSLGFCPERCPNPQSWTKTTSRTGRFRRQLDENENCEHPIVHGPKRPSLRISSRDSDGSYYFLRRPSLWSQHA